MNVDPNSAEHFYIKRFTSPCCANLPLLFSNHLTSFFSNAQELCYDERMWGTCHITMRLSLSLCMQGGPPVAIDPGVA